MEVPVATWQDVTSAAPELADSARALFDAHKHKTLATLRRDGAPRISGIEASFVNGELWLGMMQGSRKALDLRRDPRLALHSASVDAEEDGSGWPGDAKLSGTAVEITDPERVDALAAGGHLFRVDVTELVLTRVGDPPDHLVIEMWREGRGVTRVERR
jgi:Pyridoxamine 5'-phosphate oxidase